MYVRAWPLDMDGRLGVEALDGVAASASGGNSFATADDAVLTWLVSDDDSSAAKKFARDCSDFVKFRDAIAMFARRSCKLHLQSMLDSWPLASTLLALLQHCMGLERPALDARIEKVALEAVFKPDAVRHIDADASYQELATACATFLAKGVKLWTRAQRRDFALVHKNSSFFFAMQAANASCKHRMFQTEGGQWIWCRMLLVNIAGFTLRMS